MGVPKKSVKRLAAKAMSEGMTRFETQGPLRRYLDALFYYNGSADNLRVWGEKVWVFSGNTLITVLDLPNKYKNRANGIQKGKDEKNVTNA